MRNQIKSNMYQSVHVNDFGRFKKQQIAFREIWHFFAKNSREI